MTKFPYVDRFFLWHDRAPLHEQVVFYRPPGEAGRRDIAIAGGETTRGGFYSDRAARRSGAPRSSSPRWDGSFAIEDAVFDGVRYQAVFHILWSDPQRQRFYCVVGYLVNMDTLRRTQLAQVVTAGHEPLLNPARLLPFGAAHPRTPAGVNGRRRSRDANQHAAAPRPSICSSSPAASGDESRLCRRRRAGR